MSVQAERETIPKVSASTSGPLPNKDIFTDPALANAKLDDPVAKFILGNWKRIVTIIIAIALGKIALDTFQSTSEQRRAAATGLFSQIRDDYTLFVTKQDELQAGRNSLVVKPSDKPLETAEREKIEKKNLEISKEIETVRDRLKLRINSLDSPPPFDLLGKLYGGMLAARLGDVATTKASLASIPWQTIGRNGSGERMTAELAVLGLGKSLVDVHETQQLAKDSLLSLAEKGEFASVSALQALASLKLNEADKTKMKEIAATLKSRFPSQTKAVGEIEELISYAN